jgi:hypothetical protein
MPRKKPPSNFWERFADGTSPYIADRVIFGEHDVPASFVVPGIDADGNLFAEGYESEPVTDPRIRRWLDALRDFDKRSDKAPLIELLKSDFELLPILHRHLADLLWRHRRTKKADVSRATPYERHVLDLLKPLDEDPYGKHALDIRRELDDLMPQRKLLARMLVRYNFVRRTGTQYIPAYTMTADDAEQYALYMVANEEVIDLVHTDSWALVDAIEMVARKQFPPDVGEESDSHTMTAAQHEFADGLENYRKNLSRSSRRKQKSRKT